MDLDHRGYIKLLRVGNSISNENFENYRRILEAICSLTERHNHETPEMWYFRIRDPFRKILKENPEILSGNGYITMYGKHYSDTVYGLPSNYIYCSVCDSLVFIPENGLNAGPYRDNHFKSCINGDTISKEYARRNDILESIDTREFKIWQYKQYILQEEAKLYRLRLELFSQSTSHLEKDKMASVSYDHDTDTDVTSSYEAYAQSKVTVEKNTMPSAPNFEPACISVTSDNQEVISPTSYQSSNCGSNTSEIFISSRYAKQPKALR